MFQICILLLHIGLIATQVNPTIFFSLIQLTVEVGQVSFPAPLWRRWTENDTSSIASIIRLAIGYQLMSNNSTVSVIGISKPDKSVTH